MHITHWGANNKSYNRCINALLHDRRLLIKIQVLTGKYVCIIYESSWHTT